MLPDIKIWFITDFEFRHWVCLKIF